MWKQIEATPPHLTYLILSGFLILYALFSLFIRNRLHLSEPPLAMLTGIIFGPKGFNALDPITWGFRDNLTQEFTRVIVGLQVFAVGIELPKRYFKRHWKSVLWLLGPVMAFGWLVCAAFIFFIFRTDVATALTISACLTPTDPVLAASVLSNSRFSGRVPSRIKHLLSCESGCNDGVSFPFLYIGVYMITSASVPEGIQNWALTLVLWQCVFGTLVGVTIGYAANRLLRYSATKKLIDPSSFIVFYLLLSILSVGVGSTLGLDDFLVSFGCGIGFANDGWFATRTRESKLNNILDLLLNSTFFVYLGTILPWEQYSGAQFHPQVTPGRLVAFLGLILLFRRLPALLACKNFIPDVQTWRESLFCGHFGPMGVGAIFLAVEATAHLENDTSSPDPRPDPSSDNILAIQLMWAVVTFVVFGSTLVHGLSVAAISMYSHYVREGKDRSHEIGGETDPLTGMVHEDSDETQSGSESDEEGDSNDRGQGRIVLPG